MHRSHIAIDSFADELEKISATIGDILEAKKQKPASQPRRKKPAEIGASLRVKLKKFPGVLARLKAGLKNKKRWNFPGIQDRPTEARARSATQALYEGLMGKEKPKVTPTPSSVPQAAAQAAKKSNLKRNLLIGGGLTAAAGLGAYLHHQKKEFEREGEKIAQVDPYQQRTQWTCSAACFKAVLAHYGIKIPELAAIDAIGAKPGKGADTDAITAAAWKLGLEAFEYSFSSLKQAKILLDQDIPIIADIQSFKHPGKGHYVVITDIDDAGVHLMDPNVDGNQRLISHEEMDERWWDARMNAPHEHMPKWGVVILPPEETEEIT